LLRLTQAADYATRAVLHLSVTDGEHRCDCDTIAQAQAIPMSFIAKILQRLTAAGIIISFKGSCGGFVLARPPESITLLEVIQAVDGPIALSKCLLGNQSCERQPSCPLHPVWNDLQISLEDCLNQVTFAQLSVWRPVEG